MIGSEQRYAVRERHETWKIVRTVAAAFVAVLLLGGMGALLVNQDSQAATAATELQTIKSLVVSIHREQSSANADRKTIATDVAKVSGYANALAAQLTVLASTDHTDAVSICASLNKVTATLGITATCTVTG